MVLDMSTTHPFRSSAGAAATGSPSASPGASGRLTSWWRGRPEDPAWARAALLALLVATAGLYLWGLTRNGYANSFYSAAAQAGSESWKAFFYGSSDAANAITVDKPPASVWLMALSVRLLGLSSLSILLPQVLLGVASVYTLHVTVRRGFGAVAGLIAGLTLALTPVAVLMFRFNNPDALLVLLMTLGAWATMRALEHGSVRWMALMGVFVGLGFLTKTLQVLLVVPAFGLVWLLAANTTVRRRITGGVVAAATFVLSAGWWVAVVELVPASMRPYIGGSQSNSFLELTFGYNGIGRLNGDEAGSVGGGQGWGETGLLRMFSDSVGGQISWLLPAALILLVAGLWLAGRARRTDTTRAAYLLWGGWLVVTLVVLSFMAGIFHEYYTVALAPAIAALVGMGCVDLWRQRERLVPRVVLAVAALATGVWGCLLLTRTGSYGLWLPTLVLAGALLTATGVLLVHRLDRGLIAGLVLAALVTGFAGQAAYAGTTVTKQVTGSIVVAGPQTGGPGGGPGGGGPGDGGAPPAMPGTTATAQDGGPGGPGAGGGPGGPGGGMGGLLDATSPSSEIVDALTDDADSYTWVAAAVGSQNAAGLQLATELPVMSIGGFNGSDPSPTLEQFQQYVADGEIHYLVAATGPGGGGGPGGDGTQNTSGRIVEWAAANFDTVTIDGQTFYDFTQPLDGSRS